jgi:hypothetical protein
MQSWKLTKLWGQSLFASYLGTGSLLVAVAASVLGATREGWWRQNWVGVVVTCVVVTAGSVTADALMLMQRRFKIVTGGAPPLKEPYPGSMNGRPTILMQFRVGVENRSGQSIEGVRVTLDGEQPILRDTELELQGHPGVGEFQLDQVPRYVDVANEHFYSDNGERIGAWINYSIRRSTAGYGADIGRKRHPIRMIVQGKDAQPEVKPGEIYLDANGRMDVRLS